MSWHKFSNGICFVLVCFFIFGCVTGNKSAGKKVSSRGNASDYINRGIAYGKGGKYNQAIGEFNRAIELSPDSDKAYYYRALTLGKMGDHKKAIPDYKRVIELNPNSIDAYFGRGRSYSKTGQLENAIEDYDKVLSIESSYYRASYNKARICDKLGLKNDAIEAYKRFLQHAPAKEARQISQAKKRILELDKSVPLPTKTQVSGAEKGILEVSEAKKAPLIEKILKDKMKLKNELEVNLVKLRSDKEGGSLDLTEREFKTLERQLIDAISIEEQEVEAFKGNLDKIKLTVMSSGKRIYLGKKGGTGGISIRSREGQKLVRRDPWTERKTSETELDRRRPLKLYRYDGEGVRYLYATYVYGASGKGLKSVVIHNRDGTSRERIRTLREQNYNTRNRRVETYHKPYLIESSVGTEKWVSWPKDTKWALERIGLILGDQKYW